MSIKNFPKHLKPRERLLRDGVSTLSNAELLSILFNSRYKGKSALTLSNELLENLGSLHALFTAEKNTLEKIAGTGLAHYAQLRACSELNRRLLAKNILYKDFFKHTSEIKDFLKSKIGHSKKENFLVFYLNRQCKIIHHEKIFSGSIHHVTIYPREIIKNTLEHNASYLIVAHNHPSGSTLPSEADRDITLSLKTALEYIDTELLDHFLVTQNKVLSFKELGLL